MKPGDTVHIERPHGAYLSSDPEKWGNKFDLSVSDIDGTVMYPHPLDGWFVAKVAQGDITVYVPVHETTIVKG